MPGPLKNNRSAQVIPTGPIRLLAPADIAQRKPVAQRNRREFPCRGCIIIRSGHYSPMGKRGKKGAKGGRRKSKRRKRYKEVWDGQITIAIMEDSVREQRDKTLPQKGKYTL